MKKVIIIIFILCFIIASIGIVGYFCYNYYLDKNNAEIKQNFYKYAFQNNFGELFDTKFKQNIINRLNENSYESTTNIEFTNTFLNNNNLDIDKLTLELDTLSNKNIKKSDITIDYSNNNLFNISILENPNYLGIKSDDILNNYIAIRKDNMSNTLGKINNELNNLYGNIDKLKNSNINQNNLSIFTEDYSDYITVFEKYITSNEYKDEGTAIIELDGQKIETQRYSLTISNEEAMNLFAVLTDKIIEDERILKSIVSETKIEIDESEDIKSNLNYNNIIVEEENNVYDFRDSDSNNNSTNIQDSEQTNIAIDKIEDTNMILNISEVSKNINTKLSEVENKKVLYNGIKYLYTALSGFSINVNQEDVKKDFNLLFSELNEILKGKLENNSNVKFISYVANGNTIRTSILLGENVEIQLDYLNSETENTSTKVSLLEKKEEKYNGYTITFFKIKTNLLENNEIKIETISNSEIINKIVFKLNIEGSENSNKYNNTCNFLYSGNGDEGKFSTTITNTINFKNAEPGNLHSNNCLVLDDLDDTSFNYIINKLSYRTENVYEKQMSKMNLIDTNSSDTILQTNNQEKEELTDVLIENISNQMGEAQLLGEEYTIQNLKDLEIEGYDISVSVSEDLAIITINGYKFKIDKDFNLSE